MQQAVLLPEPVCGSGRRKPSLGDLGRQGIAAGRSGCGLFFRRLVACSGLWWSAASAAVPEPAAGELHTAACVAALEVSTVVLAGQVKAGQEDLKPLLAARLEFGAAFIGDAYLHGDRDEARSQSLLAAALEAQKSLSAEALLVRQMACAEEARRVLDESNFISRAVVSRLAKRRMTKLLGP